MFRRSFLSLALLACVSPTLYAREDIQYLLKSDGGRIDWSETNRMLVLDRADAEGYFRLWTVDANGQGLKCLTCNHPALPRKHQGNPAWHPSGKYIVFQAVDPALGNILSKTVLHKIFTNPGAGVQNNIWIMTRDGQRVWQITRLGGNEGVLHPHFSPDGTKLIWSQRISNESGIGRWVIKLATFSEAGTEISVSGITTVTPGGLLFYETHGFSPDGATIIFTGMPKGGREADFDIYTYHLGTASLQRLTDPKLRQWDEHAHFTPDGKRIVFMSSMGTPQPPERLNQIYLKTDYWIMDAHGSDKRRVTFFNSPSRGGSGKERVIAADLSLSGDGRYLFGYIQDPGTVARPGSVIRLSLPQP